MLRAIVAAVVTLVAAAAYAQRPLVVYCSHDADACELAAQTFQRETGIATSVTRKPTGEYYAQIRAERDNPKGDVWYGGPSIPCCRPRRRDFCSNIVPEASRARAVGARRHREGPTTRSRRSIASSSDSAATPHCWRRKGLPAPRCWSDLTDAKYARDIELSNAVTSGTGYTILATLVALYGEDGAFGYLKRLAPNVVRYTQSGTAQGPSVARGEVAIGVTFVHEFVTQQLAGFAVDIAIPCEGTGAALGGMAIINGAPHPEEARAFYDWALTRGAQELANRTKNIIIPANAAATIRPEAARFADARTLDVDPMKFGQPAERKRLLDRWQKEIQQ
jgi:iron(III) transport system substrate-binding protein